MSLRRKIASEHLIGISKIELGNPIIIYIII